MTNQSLRRFSAAGPLPAMSAEQRGLRMRNEDEVPIEEELPDSPPAAAPPRWVRIDLHCPAAWLGRLKSDEEVAAAARLWAEGLRNLGELPTDDDLLLEIAGVKESRWPGIRRRLERIGFIRANENSIRIRPVDDALDEAAGASRAGKRAARARYKNNPLK